MKHAIRYLRRLHKSRAEVKLASLLTPAEPADDVGASRPRSPTPQPRWPPPSSVPEETLTAMEIRPSDPQLRGPAARRGLDKSKTRSTSDKNKGRSRTRTRTRSESIPLNANTGMGRSVGKNKNKSKSKGKRGNQATGGTSESKAVLSKSELGLLWEAAQEETGKCHAVTAGMYINGEVAVGGRKAVTVLRRPPCARCVRSQRDCLVLDATRETMASKTGCGGCVRLGIRCY